MRQKRRKKNNGKKNVENETKEYQTERESIAFFISPMNDTIQCELSMSEQMWLERKKN